MFNRKKVKIYALLHLLITVTVFLVIFVLSKYDVKQINPFVFWAIQFFFNILLTAYYIIEDCIIQIKRGNKFRKENSI